MDAGDYRFDIFPNTTQPFGPVVKENLDITLLIFDFTCWLNEGETISWVPQPVVALEGNTLVPPWQNDYPLDNTSVTGPPNDDYPLVVLSTAITNGSTGLEVRISAGTPGLNYVVSVIVNSTVSERRKQVDCLVTVDQLINSNVISQSTPGSIENIIVIGGNTTIPIGFIGFALVENNTSAPITVTMPVDHPSGKRITVKDAIGNAGTYPITISGGGTNIEGVSTLVLSYNYSWADLLSTGTSWVQV